MNQRPTPSQKVGAYITFFVSMAIFVVLGIIGFFILSWLLIVGAMIGLIVFIIAYVRRRFSSNSFSSRQPPNTLHKGSGKVYDHDDFK